MIASAAKQLPDNGYYHLSKPKKKHTHTHTHTRTHLHPSKNNQYAKAEIPRRLWGVGIWVVKSLGAIQELPTFGLTSEIRFN